MAHAQRLGLSHSGPSHASSPLAVQSLNEFRNEKYNTNYPLTLDKNKNTERINSDYVTTDYDVMEVGIYTLELKKQGNKVVGIVEITGN